MKTINNKSSGFSLIEILVSMALVGIIVAAANQILFSFLKSEQKSRAILEVKQSGDNALSIMVNEIRNAEEITACPAGGITFDSKDGSIDNTFQCSGGQITWNGSSLTGPNLTVVDGTCSILGCALNKKYGSVIISFTLKKESTDPIRGANEVGFKDRVMLRNFR